MLGFNDHLGFAIHGGGDSGGGILGAVEGLLSFIEGTLRQSPSDTFASLLPGIAALQNLHPLVVHFPIALLTLFFVLDVLGSIAQRAEWRLIAGALLYLGTAFAGLTVAAGLAAAASVAHGDNVHDIMEHHEHLAISVLSLAIALSIWRWFSKGFIAGPANTLHLLLAAILAGMLAFTADLGGLMVYKYGVSVEAADQVNQSAAQAHNHEQVEDASQPGLEGPGGQTAPASAASHHDEPAHDVPGHRHQHAH